MAPGDVGWHTTDTSPDCIPSRLAGAVEHVESGIDHDDEHARLDEVVARGGRAHLELPSDQADAGKGAVYQGLGLIGSVECRYLGEVALHAPAQVNDALENFQVSTPAAEQVDAEVLRKRVENRRVWAARVRDHVGHVVEHGKLERIEITQAGNDGRATVFAGDVAGNA